MKQFYIFLLFIICIQVTVQAQNITGRWYSKTSINKEEVHYLLDIRKSKDTYIGFLDLPSSARFRIRLDSIEYTIDGTAVFRHASLQFRFSGAFDSSRAEIVGTVSQDSFSNQLVFSRTPQVKRTQLIKGPVPYRSKEVSFYNKDSTRLAGTITFPKEGENLSAVILITGSGPQNRDEEILGHKPFGVLADFLSRQGIVVLRYDDRGYGASEGQFRPATSSDYADDVFAAVQFLKNYKDVSIGKIGLVGHSEGGNIAPVVATMDTAVNFLVLLAAPGTSNLDSYLVSLDLILKDYPETYDRDFPAFKGVYEDMASIKDKELLRDSLNSKFTILASLMEEEEFSAYGNAENYVSSQVAYHSTDWYHYYLQFNVTPYLKSLKIPILALNGDRDSSVESKFNLKGIENTLKQAGNTQFEVLELKNVNHFFQVSVDDKIESVYFNEETFSKIALDKISIWIKNL